jgi:hypothetical protein
VPDESTAHAGLPGDKIIAHPRITTEYRKAKSDKGTDLVEKVETVLSFQHDSSSFVTVHGAAKSDALQTASL